MPICTRKGCGKDFEPSNNEETCYFHPGAPVFHEGLKSWSCCPEENKPVLDFDDFMKITGCMQIIGHTNEKQAVKAEEPKPAPAATEPTKTDNKTETYSTTPQASVPAATNTATSAPQPAPTPVKEEEDDLSVKIDPGTLCRRNGCKTAFVSDEVNRDPAGEDATCVYHPSPPIFREGSKGYLCCKRRVLEFDEFLKITGCKSGRHLFSPPKKDEEQTEEVANCRVDHYQTVDQVHVSVFGKQADKERSKIDIREEQVHLDILLPGPKRFRRTLDLFGPIDPNQSSVQFFGTKVELHLKKSDNRSWTILEKTTQDLGGISLTFGVGGRTGTIGGKDLVLDESNQIGRN